MCCWSLSVRTSYSRRCSRRGGWTRRRIRWSRTKAISDVETVVDNPGDKSEEEASEEAADDAVETAADEPVPAADTADSLDPEASADDSEGPSTAAEK